ncbi:MAG TPA: hypothetical protein VE133_16920 [Candidatus Sulfotelmatobacter sp.]|nr:hypothetical protein [Candidatus Sulfotelmatobacter sp.]
MPNRRVVALIVLLCAASFTLPTRATAAPAGNPYLYKVSLVQAAPGKLLELIDLYKARSTAYQAAGDELPLWMRHSQGDHWDLMVLSPMGSYNEFYQPQRIAKRKQAGETSKLEDRIKENVAWQEDLFAYGPPLADLRKAFAAGAFFHVEMFVALPGKFTDLYKEREMENAYAKALKEPENFIFVRDQGAAWDIFTVGVFRDLKHYAESADVPAKDQEAAAKAAGFEAPSQIGPYLRRFIREHHDTLAVAVK